jgi:hypothetical protein
MSFTPNIPASGQSLGSSRTQVLNNFSVLRSTIAANHVDVNSMGAGKHNFSEYVAQAQSPATANTEVALYCRVAGGVAQLFLQKENQIAGATDIAMTRADAGVQIGDAGWTFLPGGFIMQWGSTGVVNGAFTTTFTAHGGISYVNKVYQVFLVVDDPGAPSNPITSFTVNHSANTNTSFSGHTNRAITLSYLAIGV